jgi:hypothetical protein
LPETLTFPIFTGQADEQSIEAGVKEKLSGTQDGGLNEQEQTTTASQEK